MAQSTSFWNGSAFKEANELHVWDGSDYRHINRLYIWNGSAWKQCHQAPPSVTLTGASGSIFDATSFTFNWTLSDIGTGYTLSVIHVLSGIDVSGGISDPAASDSVLINTFDSSEQHRAELYDNTFTLVNSILFTPT